MLSQDATVPLDVLERIDKVCAGFESAWRDAPEPDLKAFLGQVDENAQRYLLPELVKTDREYREARGLPVTLDSYLGRLPEYKDALLGLLKPGLTGEWLSTIPLEPQVPPGEVPLAAVPGYEIVRELGRGGMGVVYLARHLRLKRLVALKVILAGSHANTEHRERFRLEGEAVVRLQHPNIVQIHEVGDHEGKPYYSLEFCGGGSLDQKLGGIPQIPAEAARIVELLARAIEAAHQQKVIHRDLKPANVLLTAAGAPKVTDFGLAKQLDEAGRTRTGMVIGSPLYMAPEQATGRSGEVGPAADVYSLGAILYEMLTGRPPFQGATVAEVLRQVVERDPLPPRHLIPSVPYDLQTVCLKCLAKDAGRRYASALDLAEDLRRLQAGEPILVRPVGALERGWRWCRRNPTVALLWGAFVSALVAGIAVSTFFALRATSKAADAVAAGERADARASDALAAEALAAKNARRARDNERLAYDRAYNSDLRLVQQAWDKQQFNFARQLLDRLRPEQTDGVERRGFEWGYWDRQRGQTLHEFLPHPGAGNCVAYGPDGKWLVTGGRDSINTAWSLKLLDADTGRERFSCPSSGRWIRGLAVSPDGTRFVSTADESTVRVWDATTGKQVLTLAGNAPYTTGVAYGPDGKHIATAGFDGNVRVWDAATGQEQMRLAGHTDGTKCVAYSPDGHCLASGGDDKAVYLWDTATGKSLHKLEGHTAVVMAVAFSPDGARLASSDLDGKVRVWDARRGASLFTIEAAKDTIFAVAFSRDGRRLFTGGCGGHIKAWDATTGRLARAYQGQADHANGLAVSPDGTRLASVQGNGKVVIWDATAARLVDLRPPKGSVQGFALCGDNHVYTGSGDGTVAVWDVATGAELRHFGDPLAPLGLCAVHPRGEQVVVTAPLATTEVWDPRTGTRLFSEQVGGAHLAAYSPDGTQFATADISANVIIWSSADFKELRRLKGESNPFTLTFDAEGKHLALRDREGVWIWEAATGRLVGKADDLAVFGGSGTFLSDGKHLAEGNQGGIISVYEVATMRLVQRLTGHTGGITGLASSPDGRRLASASQDGSVKVWDVVAGEELLTLTSRGGGFGRVAFSPDGRRLFAENDGAVLIWTSSTLPAR